jgi:hypothetical protein
MYSVGTSDAAHVCAVWKQAAFFTITYWLGKNGRFLQRDMLSALRGEMVVDIEFVHASVWMASVL